MKYAVAIPNFGPYSNARMVAEMAREAEEAGWDGFFLWDHMLWTHPTSQPVIDPWVTLAAMAMTTSRIKLGALVTPVARRRPWKLAREAVTLDHLSGGRIVLGVGIGGDWFGDYSAFGEPADDRTHAEMLDEGLQVIAGLWSGEPFSYEGKHYHIKDAHFLPRPLQEPRIPVWVAARWPNNKPFRRAAQWDGVAALSATDEELSPQELREMVAYIREHRTSDAPFDVVYSSKRLLNDPGAAGRIAAYEDAGITWWQEDFNTDNDNLQLMREKVRIGPPR